MVNFLHHQIFGIFVDIAAIILPSFRRYGYHLLMFKVSMSCAGAG